VNHPRFYFSFRRLALAVAVVVVSAIGVGVLTGAGGTASMTAAYPYYPPDPYCLYGNNPPKADFTYSPASPKPGELVTFTSTSTDPDGDALLTGWDFNGDWDPFNNLLGGIDQFEPVAQFTYQSAGDYRVRMGVGDRAGLLGDPCFMFDIEDKIVRIEAAGGGGTGGGGPGGGGPPGGGPTPDTTGPRIAIASINKIRRVSRKGVFTFILGPFAEDVRGTIRFESVTAVVSQVRRKKLKLPAKRFRAAKGKRVVIRTRLPRKGRQALRRRRQLRMRARIVLRDSVGNASRRTFAFTLKAPRRRSR
jgi:PKD domain